MCDAQSWWDLVLGKTERQEEKRDSRGWDGSMALMARWTWVWASSRSWWWTGKSGVLQSLGSQRVRHNWSDLNWTECLFCSSFDFLCSFTTWVCILSVKSFFYSIWSILQVYSLCGSQSNPIKYNSSWDTDSSLNPTVAAQLSKSNNASETLHNLSTQLPLWFNFTPLYLLSRNAHTCAYTL